MIISWVITALGGAVGVGIGYATLKQGMRSVREEFIIHKQVVAAAAAAAAIIASEQLTTIKERAAKIEEKLEGQVGYNRCRDMREDCNRELSKQINVLATQVQENRTIVTAALNDLQKFVGRVEQFMERNGKHQEH
jgi:hypothetical protein